MGGIYLPIRRLSGPYVIICSLPGVWIIPTAESPPVAAAARFPGPAQQLPGASSVTVNAAQSSQPPIVIADSGAKGDIDSSGDSSNDTSEASSPPKCESGLKSKL